MFLIAEAIRKCSDQFVSECTERDRCVSRRIVRPPILNRILTTSNYLARLGGLYRVASLLGLTISLLLVGVLLQKFVIRKVTAPAEEVS